ncbi:MAG: hypothetical protein Q4D29_08105, partial [Lachnospiraceae bacterium]|nr:hypothetical protein [Lachnospiraceae bacterium]
AAILNKDYELINLLTEDILNIAHPEKVNHETINTENIQEQNILKENNIRENSQGLSLFSVICITIDGVLMLFCILLFVFYRKLFLYFVKDIRILSVMLLIFSIIIFFPVLNILDINHAKRLSERC